jgi:hypothetical protein
MDRGLRMKIPNREHASHPWRIHEIAPDFTVLDVWALPTPGGPDDFPELLQLIASGGFASGSSRASRALFAIRWKLGELFGWDDPSDGPNAPRPTLRDRLPADLRDTSESSLELPPFTVLYVTDDECAAEIVNRTVHGVLHLGWVEDPAGGYHGQMAVLVKPNGRFGTAYLAAIAPFRYLVVYPAMMRRIGRLWRQRAFQRTHPTHA